MENNRWVATDKEISPVFDFSNVDLLYYFSYVLAVSLAGILIAIAVAVIAKKWEIIKFWLFLKFGIKFKDKADMMKNIASLDYDAFLNYR